MSRSFVAVSMLALLLVAGCGVNVKTPGVDVQVGPGGIKVDTPDAKVNVSAQQGVQVETPEAGVNVNADEGVKVTAPGADVAAQPDAGVKVTTPDAEVRTESKPR